MDCCNEMQGQLYLNAGIFLMKLGKEVNFLKKFFLLETYVVLSFFFKLGLLFLVGQVLNFNLPPLPPCQQTFYNKTGFFFSVGTLNLSWCLKTSEKEQFKSSKSLKRIDPPGRPFVVKIANHCQNNRTTTKQI